MVEAAAHPRPQSAPRARRLRQGSRAVQGLRPGTRMAAPGPPRPAPGTAARTREPLRPPLRQGRGVFHDVSEPGALVPWASGPRWQNHQHPGVWRGQAAARPPGRSGTWRQAAPSPRSPRAGVRVSLPRADPYPPLGDSQQRWGPKSLCQQFSPFLYESSPNPGAIYRRGTASGGVPGLGSILCVPVTDLERLILGLGDPSSPRTSGALPASPGTGCPGFPSPSSRASGAPQPPHGPPRGRARPHPPEPQGRALGGQGGDSGSLAPVRHFLASLSATRTSAQAGHPTQSRLPLLTRSQGASGLPGLSEAQGPAGPAAPRAALRAGAPGREATAPVRPRAPAGALPREPWCPTQAHRCAGFSGPQGRPLPVRVRAPGGRGILGPSGGVQMGVLVVKRGFVLLEADRPIKVGDCPGGGAPSEPVGAGGSPSRSPRRQGHSGSQRRRPGSRPAAPPRTRSGSRTRLGRGGFVGPSPGQESACSGGQSPPPAAGSGGPAACAQGLGRCHQHPQLCGRASRVSDSPSTTATLAGSMRDTISARSVKEALGQVRTCRGRRRARPAQATAPRTPAAAPPRPLWPWLAEDPQPPE